MQWVGELRPDARSFSSPAASAVRGASSAQREASPSATLQSEVLADMLRNDPSAAPSDETAAIEAEYQKIHRRLGAVTPTCSGPVDLASVLTTADRTFPQAYVGPLHLNETGLSVVTGWRQ